MAAAATDKQFGLAPTMRFTKRKKKFFALKTKSKYDIRAGNSGNLHKINVSPELFIWDKI